MATFVREIPQHPSKTRLREILREHLANTRACGCPGATGLDEKLLDEVLNDGPWSVDEMDVDTIRETFGLTWYFSGGDFIPPLPEEGCYPVPCDLTDRLGCIRDALGDLFNTSESRLRLDAIIAHAVREEHAWLAQQEVKPPNELRLTLDTASSVAMKQSNASFTVTGKINYAVWSNMEELRLSLLVLERDDTLAPRGKFGV